MVNSHETQHFFLVKYHSITIFAGEIPLFSGSIPSRFSAQDSGLVAEVEDVAKEAILQGISQWFYVGFP